MTTRSAKNGTMKQAEANGVSEARGLDPRVATHKLLFGLSRHEDVDGRNKSGHDGLQWALM